MTDINYKPQYRIQYRCSICNETIIVSIIDSNKNEIKAICKNCKTTRIFHKEKLLSKKPGLYETKCWNCGDYMSTRNNRHDGYHGLICNTCGKSLKGYENKSKPDINKYSVPKENYGQDLQALSGYRGKQVIPNKKEYQSLKINCPICKTEHWIDKSCPTCQQKKLTKDHNKEKFSVLKNKITVYCPLCGSIMVLRIAKKGKSKDQKFWGCSNFPKCRATSQYHQNI